MRILLFWITLKIVFTLFLYNADGACTFPDDLRGSWISSYLGEAEFTDSNMYLSEYDVVTDGTSSGTPSNLTCDFSSGSYYVLRTTTNYTSNSVGDYYWYICLELTSVTAYSYYYYNSRVNNAGSSLYTVFTEVCTTGQATELFQVFVKKGSESEALSYCAKPLLGVFTYTHESTCGVAWGYSLLDVCNNNRTNMIFDYNLCNTLVAFSDGGHLGCVATLTNGSTYYQSVINFDQTLTTSPRTYRFTCFVIDFDGENITVSEKGENCVQGQTSTTKPSVPGNLLYLVPNTTCYIETPTSASVESDNTAAIVAGIAVSLLVIAGIIGAVLGYKCYKKKQQDKVFTKRKIDPLISVGMAGSLKTMPGPLTSKNNANNNFNNNNNDNKSKNSDKPHSPPEVPSELQDVDAENQESGVPTSNKAEPTETKNISNGTVTLIDLSRSDDDITVTSNQPITVTSNQPITVTSNQPNGIIAKHTVANDVIFEVDETVKTEDVKPEKKVTFPDEVTSDQDAPPEGLGKREKTMLPSNETGPTSSDNTSSIIKPPYGDVKPPSGITNPGPNEDLSNFGKDKTGMNSRRSDKIKSEDIDRSNDTLFGKNGVLTEEPPDQANMLGPRDHTLTEIII